MTKISNDFYCNHSRNCITYKGWRLVNAFLHLFHHVWLDTFKPSLTFAIWSKSAGKSLVSIRSKKGTLVYEKEISLDKGFNEVEYNLSIDKEVKSKNNNFHLGDDGTYYLPIGRYSLNIKKQGKTQSKFFSIN